MSDKVASKKLMGSLFPLIIFAYIGFIYYAVVFNLYWLQESKHPQKF